MTYSSFVKGLIKRYHAVDFSIFLPFLTRLPLPVAYILSALRGWFHARLKIDWRTIAFDQDLCELTAASFRQLLPESSEDEIACLVRKRYMAQALEEFEAQLIIDDRIDKLSCSILNGDGILARRGGGRGLVMLSPHFESVFLGYVFLCKLGYRCNCMTSSVIMDPQVIPEVQLFYIRKYQGLELKMNGGCTRDHEKGLKPFYGMLQRGEALLVGADLPSSPTSATMSTFFLGAKRMLAGGALRMAQQTGSDIGSYVCRHVGKGKYLLEFGPVGPSNDSMLIDSIYRFFSTKIIKTPDGWWGADLLQAMPPVGADGFNGEQSLDGKSRQSPQGQRDFQ